MLLIFTYSKFSVSLTNIRSSRITWTIRSFVPSIFLVSCCLIERHFGFLCTPNRKMITSWLRLKPSIDLSQQVISSILILLQQCKLTKCLLQMKEASTKDKASSSTLYFGCISTVDTQDKKRKKSVILAYVLSGMFVYGITCKYIPIKWMPWQWHRFTLFRLPMF